MKEPEPYSMGDEHPKDCQCRECEIVTALRWHRASTSRESPTDFSPFDERTWGGR